MVSLLSSQEMAINSYDIVSTLQALGMMKYWKGKHIILKKQVRLKSKFSFSFIPPIKLTDDNEDLQRPLFTYNWMITELNGT